MDENQARTQRTAAQIEELRRLGWYHSIECADGTVIPGLQSIEHLKLRCAQFPIPQDLRGKRVLDIGAWDGWFSFEMERRGASVVAVDSTPNKTFLQAREMLGSKVEYVVEDVCRLTPERLGYFDIVLFLGVLYHLKHPLLGLEKVCELATEMVCVESFVTDDGSDMAAPTRLEFYEKTELCGQFDNWFGPNVPALLAMCRTVGFARVQFESVIGDRAHVTCFRKWQPVENPEGAPPRLACVENSAFLDFSFSNRRDDYVSMWFEAAASNLTTDDVFPRIGGFGSRPVSVRNSGGNGWHLNCKLPPGLAPGWHDVNLSVGRSGISNSLRIGIDVADEAAETGEPQIEIASLTDGKTWECDKVHGGADSWVTVWVKGLPDGADRVNTLVRIDGSDIAPHYISGPDEQGLRQINTPLPYGLQPRKYRLEVRVGGVHSQTVAFDLV